MTNEIATKKNNEIIFNDLDEDLLSKMSEDASEFQHNVDGEDITTPRLKLLQAMSPELSKIDPKYISGAEIGDMYELVSKTVYKAETGFLFIPVKTIINYIEWEGIGKNSKLVNNFGSDATFYTKQKNANKLTPKGKVIGSAENRTVVKTLNYYGFIFDAEKLSATPVVIPFSNSKMKVARNFNTLILQRKDNQGRTLPSFSHIYKINSVLETKDADVYANYDVSYVLNNKKEPAKTLSIPNVGPIIYNQAKELYNILNESNLNLAFKDEYESEPYDDGRV